MVKGIAYIRIVPAKLKDGTLDYSYTNEPMEFVDVGINGKLIMRKLGINEKHFGTIPREISLSFFDSNWRCVDNLKVGVKSALHRYKGKKIKRLKAVDLGNGQCDESFIGNAVELVSATRYHVVILDYNGNERILDARYANSDDWTLA